GLGHAGVDPAVGGAAVVVDLHAHGGGPVGVGRRGVGQGAGGRHRRLDRKSVVEGESVDEGEGRPGLSSRAGADGGGPVTDALGARVLVHGLVGVLGEDGTVVDGGAVAGEGLGHAGVDPAVGGAAVVVDLHAHGGGPVGVGRRGVGQGAGGRHRR